MTPEHWDRLKPLFEQAAGLPVTDRSAFIEKVRIEEPELGGMLRELLRTGDAIESFDKPFFDIHDVLPTTGSTNGGSREETVALAGMGPDQVLAGRFRLLRHVGKGGMGDVYEAEDIQLKEHVALKTIRHEIAANPIAIARFKREIQLGKKVTHPNVCRIHDLGLTEPNGGDATLFLTMEFLNGETLSSRIKREPLTAAEALPLIEDMADGLTAAHKAGVVHRDFKSGNIMLVNSGDRVRGIITDFGLARAFQAADELTLISKSGATPGTVAYMAPEQIKGEEATPATDLYALGVVIYEMLTGYCPFTGGSDAGIRMKHIQEQPRPPSELAPDLDTNWDRVILRCLRKNPKDRFQSAAAVKSALLSGRIGSYRRKVRVLLPAGIAAALLISTLGVSLNPAAADVVHHFYDRIRGAPEGPARRVLVADIENQTGEAVLDHTVREFLTSTLGQSSILKVLPDAELAEALRRMGKPAGTEVGAQLAIEICQREGLYAAIVGSITRIGSEYVIIFRAFDRGGDVLTSVTARAHSQEQIIRTIEQASTGLRKSLGESAQSITATVPLERVTSPSLQAVQYYSLGKRALYDEDPQEASSLFQRAIETDRGFAMAHDYAGIAYDSLGDMVAAREEMSTAVSLGDRVTEPEKLKISGDYALEIRDYVQAIRYYQLLSQLKPDMAAARLNTGLAYAGQFNFARALQETDAALRLEPDINAGDNALDILFASGRTQETMQRAGSVLNSHPDDPRALYIVGRCRLVRGDVSAARAIFGRLSASGAEKQSDSFAALADMALDAGHTEEARSELQRALIVDETARNPYRIAVRKLQLAAIDPEPGGERWAGFFHSAEIRDDDILLIRAADLCRDAASADRLRSIIAVLEQHRASHETAIVQSFLGIAKSRLALIENRRKDAIDLAQSGVQFVNSAFAVDHLARTYAAVGMNSEAISGFETVLSRANERMEAYDGPAFNRLREIHRDLAELYRKTGDEKRAQMQRALAVR